MSEKHSGGRPVKYDKDLRENLNQKLNEYIDKTDIPIIAEFAYKNKIARQRLYEFEELSDTIKIAIDKKEANLERKALNNEVNTTMAIFSLKQLGWKDKQEIEHSGKINKEMSNEERQELINELRDVYKNEILKNNE
jgi:Holliday junction resolvasome RuvABC DNA-binding subunit